MAQYRTEAAPAKRAESVEQMFGWGTFFKCQIAISIFYVMIRIYQQYFSWSKGLDFFSEDFRVYWWNMLIGELIIEAAVLIFGLGYIWKTRDRNLDRITPEEELRRFWGLGQWIATYAWAVYWGASFFTEQDGTWHQTVIRDTDFTPSHIIEFYLSYPIYIIIGINAYMWARTRIPLFSKSHSLPFMLTVGGPAMIFVNVALNEWGHTFWIMEELFVAPLHWGFVTLGWCLFGVYGVAAAMCPRIFELIKITSDGKAAQLAPTVGKYPQPSAS
jgi:methane/ammonia monooxygenase subunit C